LLLDDDEDDDDVNVTPSPLRFLSHDLEMAKGTHITKDPPTASAMMFSPQDRIEFRTALEAMLSLIIMHPSHWHGAADSLVLDSPLFSPLGLLSPACAKYNEKQRLSALPKIITR